MHISCVVVLQLQHKKQYLTTAAEQKYFTPALQQKCFMREFKTVLCIFYVLLRCNCSTAARKTNLCV